MRWARSWVARGRESSLTLQPRLTTPLTQLPLAADALTFAEVSKDPKGLEWLWSPQIVGLYNRLLQRCELNRHTTEAAAGALQNITAGDRRVSGPAVPKTPVFPVVYWTQDRSYSPGVHPVGGGTLRRTHGQAHSCPRDRALGGLSRGAAWSGCGRGKGRGGR